MTKQHLSETDVCVVGGGPAGATIAMELARFGRAVCLVEEGAGRAPHPAATLSGGITPLLEHIGVMDRAATAAFLPSKQILRWWDERAPLSARPPDVGLHVDRAIFDTLLLTQARKVGVRLIRAARALDARRLDAGGWLVRIRRNGLDRDVRCAVMVDATGGRGILPACWRRHRSMLVALWAPWTANTERCPEGRLEAGDEEWFWCAPFRRGRLMVSVFVDPHRLTAAYREDATDLYRRLIRRFRLLPSHASLRRIGRVRVSDAATRWVVDAAGPDFVRLGDASVRLDPLSSQGVQAAIASGLQGAVVVNTLLARPQDHSLVASFYRDRQREHLRRHAAITAASYHAVAAASGRAFWQRLARPAIENNAISALETSPLDIEAKLRVATDARLEPGAVLRGRFVESATVLIHPALERPIAFLGSCEIASMLIEFTPAVNARSAAQRWSERMPRSEAWDALRWLWRHRVIVCNSMVTERSR